MNISISSALKFIRDELQSAGHRNLKFKNRYIGIALLLTGCSSMFKAEDCRRSPETYGRCFADGGYNTAAIDKLYGFCAKRNTPIDAEKIKAARERTLDDDRKKGESGA